MLRSILIIVAAHVAAPPMVAQVVFDDFADGDFTHSPEWAGDVDRFTVVTSDTLNWLRSDGLPQNDTLHLSTASTVAAGYWRFRFRHAVNLSNVNGSRIYLVASSSDLKGPLQGYYIQFGTNNVNRVELWRQDGVTADRVRIGESGSVVPGDENTVVIEVTRDETSRWTVYLDGEPVIINVLDETYHESAAIGVWVKHNATGRDRFFWTEFLAEPDPGDITPPYPAWAGAALEGARLFVQFTEAIDPGTLTPEAFLVEPGIGHPHTVSATELPSLVSLDFDPALAEGSYTLYVEGIADQVGNVQHGFALPFDVVYDDEPPLLVRADATSATTIQVLFDKPVFGCDTSIYSIEPEVGVPIAIDCDALEVYDLHLPQPLAPQQIYTVTASGVQSLTGNVTPQTSVIFFFGEFDEPGPRDVVINEIMYAPADLPSNEYVELYNRSDNGIFDLSRLRFANATSPLRTITDIPVPIPPGSYVVLVRNPEAFEARWPGVEHVHVQGFPALVNSGDTVQLFLDDGSLIDAVPYRPSWGGAGPALERRDPDAASHSPANWGDSQHATGGTPAALNSIFEPDVWPPAPLLAVPANDGLSLEVFFDEPLNPQTVVPIVFTIEDGPTVVEAEYLEGDDFAVWLALEAALVPGAHVLHVDGVEDIAGNATDAFLPFNFHPDLEPPVVLEVRPVGDLQLVVRFDEPLDEATATDVTNYEVSDGIGLPATATLQAGSPDLVRLELAHPLFGPHFFALTIRNVEDIHGNAMLEQSFVFFYGIPEPPVPKEIVISEVMYAPADIHSNEYVELRNVSEKVFDLSDLALADQHQSVPISAEPRLLAPGDYAVLVRNPTAFLETFPGVPFVHVPGFPVLLNGGDAVVVRYVPDGTTMVTIDSVFYRPAWGGQGVALERRNPEGPSRSPTNWASSLDPRGGTPGEPNSVAPDTFAPEPLAVEVAPNGESLVVYFDEPLDTETVTPSNFTVSTTGNPASVAYDEEQASFFVVATLSSQLGNGAHVLTIDGVADLLGNATSQATLTFEFEVDVEPPTLSSVSAPEPTLVRVLFSEPVEPTSAADPAHYLISDSIGSPDSVTVAPGGHDRLAWLHLASSLQEGTLYRLTISGIADLAGNVQTEDSAYFILGEGAVPLPGDVVVNEIMFRPAEGGSEYVELLNLTGHVFDLSGFTISDEGPPRAISSEPYILPPHSLVAIARDASAVREQISPHGDVLHMSNLPQLRNTGDAVVLRFAGTVIDSIYYDPSWHRPELRDHRGVALERLDGHVISTDPGNWTSSLAERGGTPGLENTVGIPEGAHPDSPGLTVSPSPFDGDSGTLIRYRLAADAGLVRIRVFDGAGRLVRTLEDARLAGRGVEGEVVWNGRSDHNESLRVGIYVILLEAVDLAGATTEVYRAPVVLARSF